MIFNFYICWNVYQNEQISTAVGIEMRLFRYGGIKNSCVKMNRYLLLPVSMRAYFDTAIQKE